MVSAGGWDDDMRPQLAVACIYTKAVMQYNEPRRISLADQRTPVVAFTDGAWESSSQQPAGAGLVLIDAVSGTRVSHEINVPGCLVDHWKGMGKAQLTAELELLPILVLFVHYKELFQRRRVLLFVDNNAIRDAVAKGTSKSLSMLVMLSELHRIWSQIQCLCWVSRVPTLSNVADVPSRGQAEQAAISIQGAVGQLLEPSSKPCDLICDAASFIQMMKQHL